jgi:hypothetical protein
MIKMLGLLPPYPGCGAWSGACAVRTGAPAASIEAAASVVPPIRSSADAALTQW